MSTGEYLNEEKYQKGRKTLLCIACLIIALGLLVGGGLIVGGITRKNSASQIDTSMPTPSADDYMRGSDGWMDRVSAKNDAEFEASGMIGGGVFAIFASFIIALPLFVLANQRKILAFQAQTVAPVAKEGIEKATPVVGKAAGSIAKEISKGIQEGKAESVKGKEEPKK